MLLLIRVGNGGAVWRDESLVGLRTVEVLLGHRTLIWGARGIEGLEDAEGDGGCGSFALVLPTGLDGSSTWRDRATGHGWRTGGDGAEGGRALGRACLGLRVWMLGTARARRWGSMETVMASPTDMWPFRREPVDDSARREKR